jgi:Holliday junction resolvase RusA-like endonuclease
VFHFSIAGAPVGAGRPRAVYIRAIGRARVYQPDKSSAWKATAAEQMRTAWSGRAPLDVPVVLIVQFIAARPKSLQRKKDPDGRMWRPKKPDLDNAWKLLADCMVDAGVLRDDAYIVRTEAESLYARKDEGPSVALWLERCQPFPVDLEPSLLAAGWGQNGR